jgi:hypothetical protein
MAVSEEIRQPRDERTRDAPAGMIELLFVGLPIGVLATREAVHDDAIRDAAYRAGCESCLPSFRLGVPPSPTIPRLRL